LSQLKLTFCTVFFIFSGLLQSHAKSVSDLTGSRPNIIYVMTDDQGYGDLACHGHPFVKTPNIDKLYTQSLRLTDYHVSPTCAPTRAALMSGKAPFKNGITHTILERERMALSSKTVAEVLKEAGYATGIFGKWHLGDADEYQPNRRGFDEMFIHGAGGIGQNFPGTQGAVPGTSYFDPYIKHNDKIVKTKGYCTDVFFQQALSWIKEQKDKPFFAYIPTNAPHGPFIVGDEYKKLYEDKTSGKSVAFYGMITNIDDNMGILMKKLEEWGLAENTLLIYTTDNGSSAGTWNYNMKGKKGSVDEGGSRVPMFMRWPAVLPAGVDADQLTRHVDVFPTFAALAGAKLSPKLGLDGRNMLPIFANKNTSWEDRHLFFHKGRWPKINTEGRWGKGDPNPDSYKDKSFAVRSKTWRLVENKLYNIDKDPNQTQDVIKEHPEVAAELKKAYDAWWKEVRPMMVNEAAPLDVGKPFIEMYEKQKASIGIPNWEVPKL
jgi:arylsulfatase